MAPPLVLTARTRTLMIVPIFLAIATVFALFAHSDVNTPMLWSQCHAHARIPALSRVPLLGTPLCYLVSFFRAALDATRGRAIMAVVLALVGALLTVCAAESARGCNRPARLVANPTPAWLLFNLLGGALVWQLLIVPAQIQRLRNVFLAHKVGTADEEGEVGGDRLAALRLDRDRNVADSRGRRAGILPAGIRFGVQRTWDYTAERTVHLETHRRSLLAVYALPFLSSLLAHSAIIWSLTRPDDRKEMTRSCVTFIVIDFAFIGATVLYWVLVETNWKVPAYMVGLSALLGPGAGVLGGWLLRENVIQTELDAVLDLAVTEETADEPSEQTPLL
ncbi:hypothetical protein BBAD15_g10410 [Beauveria bassiana D1-5]|uniref:Uncharacterized protein n=1 Tax=Beauveria bassiana D1-5 TaxID=1245745 RepID=A0A0A2V907_BEABA|nr:hypothetical protein BBAD15_g10410 [Beauveria bassiana D1-5]